jgi:hypothetical protein
MKRFLSRSRGFKLLLALMCAAGVFGIVSVVQAAIPDSNGVVHGCIAPSGNLRVIDSATSACKRNETSLDWNQMGLRGPTGATGPTGAKGDTGSPGPSSGVQTRVPGGIQFDATATPVVSLTLPAGNWMLIGHAEMIAGAGVAQARCFVATDTAVGPLSSFQTSEPNRPVVAFHSGVSLAQPKTVNVSCQVTGGGSPITAFNRMLMAIQVGTLTAQ